MTLEAAQGRTSYFVIDPISASTGSSSVTVTKAKSSGAGNERVVEAAVFAHIRAMRALGRKTINTMEIAAALRLSVGAVNNTVERLKKRGIRLAP